MSTISKLQSSSAHPETENYTKKKSKETQSRNHKMAFALENAEVREVLFSNEASYNSTSCFS